MTPVTIFDTKQRKKIPFTPIDPNLVKFYSCGPTTYDFLHVGNARALVVGDIIFRALKSCGYNVDFVRNFTDVDDKIIEKAKERNIDAIEHSSQFIDECLQDMGSLNLLPSTHTPKVSETMDEIIQFIEGLEEKSFAYEVDGEVLFHVPEFKEYGKLSGRKLEELQHGKRVEVAAHKKHPSDFVLWKPAKDGGPSWDSKWGKGRPGWHIECSAMAKKFLGESIDIHHGGVDLIFPHHENEVAQSEALNEKPFVNHWCHNEFVNFSKEKMSKSLGNVITIREFVETYSGMILRFLVGSVHYRSKLEWTEDAIDRAINEVDRIHQFVSNWDDLKKSQSGLPLKDEEGLVKSISDLHSKMIQELASDFNIPSALSEFFTGIRLLNREVIQNKCQLSVNASEKIDLFIEGFKNATGLVHDDPKNVLTELNELRRSRNDNDSKLKAEDIDSLIVERKTARAAKDWKRADEIRDILNNEGVVVKDNPDGTVSWSYE
jgi:cysteinyl-tRNA synthetase